MKSAARCKPIASHAKNHCRKTSCIPVASTLIVGGTGGTRPPIEIERPPIEISAPFHRDLSAGLWEEKVPVFGRKNRLNS